MLDPGIGFGKTVEHNLELLAPPRRARRARLSDPRSAPRASRSSGASRGAARADERARRTIATNVMACSAARALSRARRRAGRRRACGRGCYGQRAMETTRTTTSPRTADDERGARGGGGTQTVVTIEISGLSLYTHVGVSAAEREVGQRLLFDIRIDVGESDATETDRIEDTIDYARGLPAGRAVAQQRNYKTLERLCTAIADRIIEDFGARGRLGQGGEARAADPAARRGGLGRGLARAARLTSGE